ncbi:NHL repeat-containing protein [bacterium]|nr:NHL repeat-containing protein [bacterium]
MKSVFFLIFLWAANGSAGDYSAPQARIRFTYLASWGEAGSGPGQFKAPEGLDVDPSGNLYVADTGNNRIQKWDAAGNCLASVGGFGWDREQFDRPVAVCAGNGLDVFVADYGNGRIERYDKDLHFLASLTSSDSWPLALRFGFPRDVGLSDQGELLCLDGENRRVLKLDILGSPLRSFGDFDSGEGSLSDPFRMLITRNSIWISDRDDPSIVLYDTHGNFLRRTVAGSVPEPAGMTGLEDELVLAVGRSGEWLVFSENGGMIGRPKLEGFLYSQFREPVDAAFWKGRLYILDRMSCSIMLFQMTHRGE